jgi:ubiquinone/menaquinone biosynthesis C-methylase UbiE
VLAAAAEAASAAAPEPAALPDPSSIGSYYDRFWQPDNAAAQEEHDFLSFQASADRSLEWLIQDGGGLALKSVLEIGPGRGRDTEMFARGGARVVAIDVSIRSVELARERLRRAGFGDRILGVVADAAHLPFRDASLDVSFSRFTIAHIDIPALGRELARVLRPRGRALMVEPLAGNPLVKIYRRLSPTGCRETAPRYVTLRALREIAKAFPGGWRHKEHYLFSVAALALRRTPIYRPVAWLLQLLEAPLAGIGPLRGLCWVVVAELRR